MKKEVKNCHNSLNFANFQNRITPFDFYGPKLYYSIPNSIFKNLPLPLKKKNSIYSKPWIGRGVNFFLPLFGSHGICVQNYSLFRNTWRKIAILKKINIFLISPSYPNNRNYDNNLVIDFYIILL